MGYYRQYISRKWRLSLLGRKKSPLGIPLSSPIRLTKYVKICIYVYVFICMYMRGYMHIYVCVYVCICIYVCICVYKSCTLSATQCYYVSKVIVYLEEYVVEFAMLCIIELSLPSCMHSRTVQVRINLRSRSFWQVSAYIFVYSVISNDAVSGQRRPWLAWRPWLACAYAQADQGFRCPLMPRRHLYPWHEYSLSRR